MSRPLNFLQLTTFYPPYHFGGDGMYVQRLAHALGDRGHHVDVVHCIDAYRLFHPDPPAVERLGHPNVTVNGLKLCVPSRLAASRRMASMSSFAGCFQTQRSINGPGSPL